MSDIKRYRIAMQYRGASFGLKECPDGDIVMFCDHEAALAAERQRSRKEEVGPLMAFAEYMIANENMTFAECSIAEDLWRRCRDAIAATKTAQKENPNE